MENKELQQKYQDIIMDFSYFKISDAQEAKISMNPVSFILILFHFVLLSVPHI